jgi:hypothetical protein
MPVRYDGDAVAVRRLATLLFALLFAAGCDDAPNEGDVTSFAIVLSEALADDIVLIRLTVLDEDASCDGAIAVGGMALSGLQDIVLGPTDSQSLTISPGKRTFSAKGFDSADAEIASGCTTLDLAADRDVRITMEGTTGGVDAGVAP